MDDMQLLREYAETGSELAFAEIVSRHLGWVYAVCLRGVRDRHLAEDVAQAVFVLLARKARQIDENTVLRGWLFKTSRFAVSDANKKRARENRKLVPFCEISETHLTRHEEAAWEEIVPILDEAVSCLSVDDRQAVLLRFYENHSMAAIGQRLGISEEAAKKRVSRAVDKLRGILSRQGAAIASAMLLGLLLVRSAVAMPKELAATVVSICTGEIAASSSAAASADRAATAMVRAARRLLAAITAGVAAVLLLIAGGLMMLMNLPAHQPAAQYVELAPRPAPVQFDLDRVQKVLVGSKEKIFLSYIPGEEMKFDAAMVPVNDAAMFAVVLDKQGRAWSKQLDLSPLSLNEWETDAPPWLAISTGAAQRSSDPAAVLSVLLGDAPAVLSKSMLADAVSPVPPAPELSGPELDVPSGAWTQLPTHRAGKHVIVDHNPLPHEKMYDQLSPGGVAPQDYVLVPEPGALLAAAAALGLLLRRSRRGR
ncbi:MAG: RNA polymerase sigma factor [Tepidisphaerales bacterium]